MEYNEYNNDDNRKRGSSAGFYAIIACCLVILGAVAWFAVSNLTRSKNQNENSSSDKNNYSSNDINSNTNSNDNFVSDIINSTPSQPTAKDESKIPYSSVTSTPQKKAFTLPVNGQITKGYSETALQYSSTFGDMRLHTGIDIKCEKNAQIKSSASGTVTDIKDDSAFGKIVTIDHGDGIVLNYCGLNSISVKVGQKVSGGDIIGTIGSIPCESSDGVHLHLTALIEGKISSPMKALGLE